ncbi:putative Tau-tubulin kinase [Blattamonas nauphoetae]|uniref:non-specific serine/threonine protein kinase n=1 Tax=Blattamonas nauphoetae TaxID=2049346 RepID=A0ABQ9XM48_9EUKA|nr:putative Tau-tubulin kinase [Blattamonas nauphoetae]
MALVGLNEKKPDIIQLSDNPEDKLYVFNKLGQGGFGIISRCKWKGRDLAMKREKKSTKNASLKIEATVLKAVQGLPHFPKLYHSGTLGQEYFLTMELLGQNLMTIMRRRKRKKFSTITTALVGLQCLEAIEIFHSKGFIHRDIKPANFCVGVGNKTNHIHLIDFGLTKKINPFEPSRPSKTGLGFRGTLRYASLNSHKGLELGRVDDLWSLLYMLVELSRRKLPWHDDKEKNTVSVRKLRYRNHRLVKDMPSQYCYFVDGLSALTFTDQPNYAYFKELLLSVLSQFNCPTLARLDWDAKHPIDLQQASYLDNECTQIASTNLQALQQQYLLKQEPTKLSDDSKTNSQSATTLSENKDGGDGDDDLELMEESVGDIQAGSDEDSMSRQTENSGVEDEDLVEGEESANASQDEEDCDEDHDVAEGSVTHITVDGTALFEDSINPASRNDQNQIHVHRVRDAGSLSLTVHSPTVTDSPSSFANRRTKAGGVLLHRQSITTLEPLNLVTNSGTSTNQRSRSSLVPIPSVVSGTETSTRRQSAYGEEKLTKTYSGSGFGVTIPEFDPNAGTLVLSRSGILELTKIQPSLSASDDTKKKDSDEKKKEDEKQKRKRAAFEEDSEDAGLCCSTCNVM